MLLLAKIEDEQLRATYLKDLDLLTRAQLERNLGKGRTDNDDVTGEPKVINAEDLRIADEIQRALGMKVKLIRSNSSVDSGKLMVEFYAEGDLQILFRKLIAE